MQLYAQSDVDSMREALGKFLEQLLATGRACSQKEFGQKSSIGSLNCGLGIFVESR